MAATAASRDDRAAALMRMTAVFCYPFEMANFENLQFAKLLLLFLVLVVLDLNHITFKIPSSFTICI